MTGYQSKKAAARDKLAQPAQEPVAWIQKDMQCDDFDPDSVTCEKPARAADGWEWIPLYTTPPQRPWVGLTDKEVDQFHNWKDCTWFTNELVRHVEATLRSKNT